MITCDVETVGLHGPIVLIQWAENDGEIHLHEVWKQPIRDTLSLIEYICQHQIVGFNLVYDWFHICQLYTTLLLLDESDRPPDIFQYAFKEPLGRNGPCLKPVAALDLMLHARKGPYQSTMDRGDIRIKRVPVQLADLLANELEKRVPLKDIYFARRSAANKFGRKWQVFPVKSDDPSHIDGIHPDFKDVVLKFKASSALKALAADALQLPADEVMLFSDVALDKRFNPIEYGFAPFALAVVDSETDEKGNVKVTNWKGSWPTVIKYHIEHWHNNELARKYAAKDVELTRALYYHFGCPEFGDDDSELSIAVAAARWRGYAIDIDGLKDLIVQTEKKKYATHTCKKCNGTGKVSKEIADFSWIGNCEICKGEGKSFFEIPTDPRKARKYLQEVMDETEILGASIEDTLSTKRIILEKIAKDWKTDCPNCKGKNIPDKDCTLCKGGGLIKHPACFRAKEILQARQANNQNDLYKKLIKAGRFHASTAIIGTLSSRMSGGGSARGIEQGGKAKGDRLNPQGISKRKDVRGKFPLAFKGTSLEIGDFASFEVSIGEAVYSDDNLRKALLTCEKCNGQMKWELNRLDFICQKCGHNEGKSIHALFGLNVYPEFKNDYWKLKNTKGTEDDKYTRSKSSVFLMMYMGTKYAMKERLGVEEETAEKAIQLFHLQFPGIRTVQEDVYKRFQSMKQIGGIGTKVEWHEPDDYAETMLGFKRYFTLENIICKALFDLAANPPKEWLKIKIKVVRRDRIQTAYGAVQSALYGAAFSLQQSNVRAAGNHYIQSVGATVTKHLQRKIWDLQPSGVNEWVVQPMNVHDEICCPTKIGYQEQVKEIVINTVESFRPKIPLVKMDWKSNAKNWAEK